MTTVKELHDKCRSVLTTSDGNLVDRAEATFKVLLTDVWGHLIHGLKSTGKPGTGFRAEEQWFSKQHRVFRETREMLQVVSDRLNKEFFSSLPDPVFPSNPDRAKELLHKLVTSNTSDPQTRATFEILLRPMFDYKAIDALKYERLYERLHRINPL